MKNGKIPPNEMDSFPNIPNQNKLENANQTAIDNLTEYDSLEQDGVLVVNISTDNILNLDELYLNVQIANITNKMEDITNKIQSNSREITGDSKNIRIKDIPENITVAPAPTNGVLSTNEQEEELNSKKFIINKTLPDLSANIEANDLLKPTESLQSLVEETNNRKRRRRRRHGNGRRYVETYGFYYYLTLRLTTKYLCIDYTKHTNQTIVTV